MSDASRNWENHEVALIETVASQTRSAVDAAKLQYKEHNIAIQLQAALQPELSVDVKGLSIASYYRAALDEANVGGDFYDAFTLVNGQTAFVVGDVSGKGLAAASQVAAIRHMLRCLLQTMPTLADAVEQLNLVLIEQNLLPSFATLFVGIFNPSTMLLEYVSCGHEPGLVYKVSGNGTVDHLEATGPVIGVFERAFGDSNARLFASERKQMQPGDALLLYTDGVCDAGSDTKHLLGVKGIATLMSSYFDGIQSANSDDSRLSAPSFLQYCMNETEAYAAGVLRDDICLLAVIVSPDYCADHITIPAAKKHGGAVNNLLDNQYEIRNDHLATEQIGFNVEELRKSMLADVLKLATRGKLRIVTDSDELPEELGNKSEPVQLDIGENVRSLRRAVRLASAGAGLDDELSDSLEMAAGEAANNSLVHASGGIGLVSWDDTGSVQVRIHDQGKGIPYDDLPRATLERGYTTAGTLGQGFWIILQSVKHCWILTNDDGTLVVLEQDNEDRPSPALPMSVLI